MKLLQSIFIDVRVSTLADLAVEFDASVFGAMVAVGAEARGDPLTNKGQGLPEVDVIAVEGTCGDDAA